MTENTQKQPQILQEPEPIPLLWTSYDDAKERGEFLKKIEKELRDLKNGGYDDDYVGEMIDRIHEEVKDFNDGKLK